ncbi:integrin alpha-3 isoform X2 [Astyanax mexicanus]|uniref:integrin alpha-3 isoform X2 n=1 Tax=Astyanax mexicanus TaxID=7994 RepID=UPI0020CAC42A|nr:integrin alpha-3 isoform X2 [Astyanax mexicanus]
MRVIRLSSPGGTGRFPEAVVCVCVCVCVSVCVLPLSFCFNVDSRFALLKQSPNPGSLFGLSVALHQQTNPARYLLLVGAPKERAEPTISANETGDMFTCPISTDPRDCRRSNLITSEPLDPDGIVEGMWLGVSVASQPQGGRVLACGHRYIRKTGDKNILPMIGKCFIRGNDLNYEPDKDYQWQYRYEVCDPTTDLLQEGLCNMGISAVITQKDVIAGAPGCYNWQGNSFVIYRNPNDKYDIQKIKFPDLQQGNIYMGYSVGKDSGVLNEAEDTVVSGAPRDESKGSVILAKEIKKPDGVSELRTQVILRGQQVGSYFGNSIAIVDINNDGWKELIVGAPFYFDRRKEEGGAVYLFMNENGSFQDKTDLFFTGPKQSGFGMAVAAIGDVNQDGFQDFAVGAPYHSSGRVYIWMGSKDGLSKKPSQVIEGKDITNGGFQTFGYSISGGLDVDDNKYPDMVVGSLDDRVVLLRSRPVIHLKKSFTVTPLIINPQSCDSCIEVKVCFSYTVSTGDSNYKKNITVKFTVEADLLQRSTRSRVQFLSNNMDTYTGYLSMPSSQCQNLQLALMTPIRNKVAPLSFSLNVSLYEPPPVSQQQLQNLDAYPVISQGEALTDRTEIHFEKLCGLDNKCESNLQMSAMFANPQQEPLPVQGSHQVLLYDSNVKKVHLQVNVSNFLSDGRLAEDAYNTVLNITIPPFLQYSAVRGSAVLCVAEGIVLCELGDPFRSEQQKEFTIEFETSGITLDTQEIEVILQLSTLSIQNDLAPLTKVLMVEYTLQPSIFAMPHSVRVEFSGEVVGESAMKSTADIGSPVEFTFTVTLNGRPLGSLGFLQVGFEWPYEVENEKWLLYLAEIQVRSGTSVSFCRPAENIVNPLNLLVSERNSIQRRRRSDEGSAVVYPEAQAALNSQSMRRRRVQLSCRSGGGAKCQTFSCPLLNMTSTTVLMVRARLWNSTMLEDYRDSETRIEVLATLQLITDKPTIRMDNASSTFYVEVVPAGQKEMLYEAPLWIIIVSVLAGVILLGLIILLLWKCGFFRRASTRELYEAKSQKAEMKVQPSETNRLTEED